MLTKKKKPNGLLIKTRNLGKVYSRKKAPRIEALEGINMEIFKGEFLAIIGRSGSGKTTLLNLLGALDRPTSGEIEFEGTNLSDFSNRDLALLRREKIGFIFQVFNLLPSLTTFENVESALVQSKKSKDEINHKISALLDSLELTEMSGRFPLELSAGQQQKVAIARALVKDPTIILADEPTGEMDPIGGREILEKLVELNRTLGITLIVASHGKTAYPEADRSLFLKSGRIVTEEEAGY
jgi:putative ABC transport system ATP-binding protein